MSIVNLRVISSEEIQAKGHHRKVEVYIDPNGKPVRFRVDSARERAVCEVFHDYGWREVHTLMPPLVSMESALQRLFKAAGLILQWPED
jgi:hypothetical protein